MVCKKPLVKYVIGKELYPWKVECVNADIEGSFKWRTLSLLNLLSLKSSAIIKVLCLIVAKLSVEPGANL